MDNFRTMIKIMEKPFSKLIPCSYRKEPSMVRDIVKWLLIGLLIRVSLMPITVYYPDLLSIYWRASTIAYEKLYWVGQGQMVAHYLHALFLWILRPLMPYFTSILHAPLVGYGADWDVFTTFVNHPNVFRTLFLFKIPYLVFELGCAFLLLRIIPDEKKGLIAFIFWIINPIVIFSTYVAGRYEVISIFLILLSLWYARKNQMRRSLLFLGISTIVRWYPLILLPFFVVILGKRLWERLRLVFWGLLPLALMTIFLRSLGRPGAIQTLAQLSHGESLVGMSFYLAHLYDYVFVFVVAYTVLWLYTYLNTDYSFGDLCRSVLVVLLIFFATCFFHAHYFIWLIPLLALQIVEDRRFVGLFALQVLFYTVYTFQWQRHLAGYLFTPLDYYYFVQLKSPFEIINRYYPIKRFIGIFRSGLSGTSLLMCYLIFKELLVARRARRG